jgi:hypothetical protein
MQVRPSTSASDQELSLRIRPTHERRGSRVRASPQGELRAEGAGGHERDGPQAAHPLQGEGQVREVLGQGRQEKKVRRCVRRARLHPGRPQVQEVLLSGGQRSLGNK